MICGTTFIDIYYAHLIIECRHTPHLLTLMLRRMLLEFSFATPSVAHLSTPNRYQLPPLLTLCKHVSSFTSTSLVYYQ